MYLGRIVAVGMTEAGQAAAMYRVSSRSFPNRESVLNAAGIGIVPKAGFEDDLRKNPYIAYNCIRLAGKYAVASNGSHTDPVAEKLAQGMSVRDALTLSLLAMDYEKDSLNTPRIVAAIDVDGRESYLGIVRKDAILVREFKLCPGEAFYISTYGTNFPCESHFDPKFDAANAEEAARYVIDKGVFANFSNAVTAAAALAENGEFKLAMMDAPQAE